MSALRGVVLGYLCFEKRLGVPPHFINRLRHWNHGATLCARACVGGREVSTGVRN